MALTQAEQLELEQLEQEEAQSNVGEGNVSQGLVGRLNAGDASVERKLEERGDESFGEAGKKFQDVQGGFGKTMAALNIVSMPFERFEAGISNVAMALQDGNVMNVLSEFEKGVRGKKLGEFGDVYRKAGVPEFASSLIGLASSFVPIVSAIGGGMKALVKITGLNKFTDKGLRLAGNQLAQGSDEAVEFIGKNLENVYAPINNIAVDGIDLMKALDDAPDVVVRNIEKQLGRNIEEIAEAATIAETRSITQMIGKLKPRAFGKGDRGVVGTIEDASINKTYANLKGLVQDTLSNSGLEKQAKLIVDADDAFAKTINASNFIKKAITESTLKQQTQASKVAKGIKTGGDLSSRSAVNTLLKGGKEAQDSIVDAIGLLNRYNRAVTATEFGGKILNYSILGGVAGSIGARSTSRAFDGGDN